MSDTRTTPRQHVIDVLSGQSVRRPAVGPLAVHYCAQLAGVSLAEYTMNADVLADCVLKYHEQFRPDAIWLSADTWVTAEAMGEAPVAVYDVGVAGLHRLLSQREALQEARVLVVAAGMEGALPSVVGGLVPVPVIALPTSVGYGLSLGGLAAMLAMMNACAPNVTVVNVDNGFGAGYVASLINRTGESDSA